MAAIEAADVSFLKRKRKEPSVSPKDASLIHAETRLEELRTRVKSLQNVKTVVTIRTRPQRQ